ncbi:MAG: Cbp1 family collagen-binding glycoprotein adhesin [Bacteroidia bacterium]
MKTVQKMSLLIVTIFASFLISCNRHETTTETDAQRYQRQEAALHSSRDSVEHVFAQTLDEINASLSGLQDKQELLAYNSSGNNEHRSMTKKEEIDNKIAVIRTVLEKNHERIEQLKSEVASYAGSKRKWKKELQKVESLMKEKEDEIASLRVELDKQTAAVAERDKLIGDQNNKIAELTSSVQFAEGTSNKMERELYKGYYTAGTAKELRKNNVVQKEGGILGIGRTETLKPDFEKAGFTEIDTRQATGIVINGKKAKLITHHPIDSYELKKEDNDTEYLTIKNPDRFWSASRYLVVETK